MRKAILKLADGMQGASFLSVLKDYVQRLGAQASKAVAGFKQINESGMPLQLLLQLLPNGDR
jgi:hypothetical protein